MADTTATMAATATSRSCIATPFSLSTFQCDDLSYGHVSDTTLYILPVVGDADIAGIGVSVARFLDHIWLKMFAQVIVAFLVSAYVTLLSALIAYWGGFLPDNLLTTYDIRFMRARKMRSEEKHKRWSHVLVKAILVISDQQIVTGVSILLAGYIQIMSMSVYHWQIILYLAWMSSNTHLTTLTVLRDHFEERTVLKNLRLIGMLILLLLLFAGLLPTVTGDWFTAQQSLQGNPVRCYWNRWTSGTSPDAVLSIVILVSAYIWKFLFVFCEGDKKLRRWILDRPLKRLSRAMRRNFAHSAQGRMARWKRICKHRSLVAVCVWLLGLDEFARSFAASLWMLAAALSWGSVQLFRARNLKPGGACTNDNEPASIQNQWGFGQLLPLLLLMLPLLAVLDETYDDVPTNEGCNPNHASTTERPHTVLNEYPAGDITAGAQQCYRFINILDAEEPHRTTLLYESWFFVFLLFYIVVPFTMVPIMASLGVIGDGRVWKVVVLGACEMVGGCLTVTLFGMWTDRLFA